MQTGNRSKLLTVMKSSPPPAEPRSGMKRRATDFAIGSAAPPPKSLRELVGRAYMKRVTTAWRHEASPILGIPARADLDGIETAGVSELTTLANGASSTTIGAFAPLRTFADACACIESVAIVRLHLSRLNARLTVINNGELQWMPLDDFVPGRAILPVSIEIPTRGRASGIAVLRSATGSADRSDLSVATALRITPKHRFDGVRILISLDGVVKRAYDAESTIEGQRFGLKILDEVARLSAAAVDVTDASSAVAARAVSRLVLEALRESIDIMMPQAEAILPTRG